MFKQLMAVAFGLALLTPAFAAQPGDRASTDQAVVKMPLEEGVSMDDAVESMKLRANMLNMKLVGELPLSKQLKAMGHKARRMEVYQFCNPLIAQQMVEANIDLAAYLPCRISLVEDEQGKGWLVMMNLDKILQRSDLPPELHDKALGVRDALNQIMKAGASGAL